MIANSSGAVEEPIDAIVTWVDGNEPRHRAKLEAHLASIGRRPSSAQPTRFSSTGEIDWCITSLVRHAPFLRRIHIVTDQQIPAIVKRSSVWPAVLRDKLCIVDHLEIFRGHEDVLPTFNSLSIETMLFRVPGLAEQFVYFNDDFMLLRPVQPDVWFRNRHLVLRGQWRRMKGRGFFRRLGDACRDMLGAAMLEQRASYTTAQALAAQRAGFKDKFLVLEHQPHPMRRSALEQFFDSHPQLLRNNISPRLRDASQFQAQALAAHLALAHGEACIEAESALLYLKPASTPASKLRRQLDAARNNPQLRFGCVQNLDDATADARQLVGDALDQWIPAIDEQFDI
ncbi:MAG: Stealth CR1 domain-containing protein [Steroidobacteraceae bacterium]